MKKKKLKKNIREKIKFLPIIIGVVIVLLAAVYIFVPRIELNGKKTVVLTIGKEYKESGYKAYLRFNDISNKVSTEDNINEDKLGNYYVNYYVKFGPIKIAQRRTVKIVDNVKPKIKIEMENKNFYVCPGKKLGDIKYTATDNYDGDVTKKVKVTKEKDKVTFKVKDKNGNEKVVTKDIYYVDIKKPDLKLKEGEITIAQGDKYEELGATAIDNCDGDVTKNIKIDSKVDTNTIGKYEVTYEVKDKSNNKATVKRVVNVIEPSTGTIYLTFDDGPLEGTTNVILDILKEENVKATFFVTNGGPDYLIKREFDEGHSIALHTASHNYAYIYSSEENYLADLNTVSSRVERITGKKSMLLRFPGGSSNTISRRYSSGIMTRLSNKVHSMGYKYYDWDVSSGDAAGGSPSPNDIYSSVVNSIRPDGRNIVLMHDIKTYTRDALRNIIKWGKANGYRFAPIDMNTEEHHQRINN